MNRILMVMLLTLTTMVACSGENVPSDGGDADSGGGHAGVGETGGSMGGTGGTAGGIDGGAAGQAGAGVPNGQPRIVFEASRENHYGSRQSLNGIYITAAGDVFGYDFYEDKDEGAHELPPPAKQRATAEELRQRWGNVKGPIGHVPLAELQRQLAAVDDLAEGVLLDEMGTPDLAELTYLAYRYDDDNQQYARVLVDVSGRFNIKNLAPGADDLVSWLSAIHGSYPSAKTGEVCMGATCSEPAPACLAGETPNVWNGCWGVCVRSGYCLEVEDCSWCSAGDVCTVSATGTFHCSLGCGEADPCDCLLGPCAGGSDFCTSGSGSAVTCGVKQ